MANDKWHPQIKMKTTGNETDRFSLKKLYYCQDLEKTMFLFDF